MVVVLGIYSAEVVIQHELEMTHAVGFNSKKRMLHGHDRSVYLEDRVVTRQQEAWAFRTSTRRTQLTPRRRFPIASDDLSRSESVGVSSKIPSRALRSSSSRNCCPEGTTGSRVLLVVELWLPGSLKPLSSLTEAEWPGIGKNKNSLIFYHLFERQATRRVCGVGLSSFSDSVLRLTCKGREKLVRHRGKSRNTGCSEQKYRCFGQKYRRC